MHVYMSTMEIAKFYKKIFFFFQVLYITTWKNHDADCMTFLFSFLWKRLLDEMLMKQHQSANFTESRCICRGSLFEQIQGNVEAWFLRVNCKSIKLALISAHGMQLHSDYNPCIPSDTNTIFHVNHGGAVVLEEFTKI